MNFHFRRGFYFPFNSLFRNARRFGGFASTGRQLFVDGFKEDEAVDVSFQLLFLFRTEADAADVAFAIGKCLYDAREAPLIPRRIFGDDDDVADDDVATVAGPFPALL